LHTSYHSSWVAKWSIDSIILLEYKDIASAITVMTNGFSSESVSSHTGSPDHYGKNYCFPQDILDEKQQQQANIQNYAAIDGPWLELWLLGNNMLLPQTVLVGPRRDR